MLVSLDVFKARVIADLITQAGWVDNADELLESLADELGLDGAIEYAERVDELAADCDELLGDNEKLNLEVANWARNNL